MVKNNPFLFAGNGKPLKSSDAHDSGAHSAPPTIDVPEISLELLKEKTDNFGSKSLIGEGSYGRVYYAQFDDEKVAAIKKLDASDPNTNNEFLSQVRQNTKILYPNTNIEFICEVCANP